MTIERLRSIHQTRPFRPFVMHLADGKTVRVTHPETLAYTPSGRTIFLAKPDDSIHHIDLLMVVRIEVSNGARKRNSRK